MVTDETGRPQVNDLDFTPGPQSQSANPVYFRVLLQFHSGCTTVRALQLDSTVVTTALVRIGRQAQLGSMSKRTQGPATGPERQP